VDRVTVPAVVLVGCVIAVAAVVGIGVVLRKG
jgi:hypothetical protein